MTERHPLDPDSLLSDQQRALLEAFPQTASPIGLNPWEDAGRMATAVTNLHANGWEIRRIDVDPLPEQAHARHGDPKTSHVAADSIGNLKERHAAVLQIAQTFADAFTYDELVHRYDSRRENGYSYGKRTPTFVLDLPKMEPQSIRSRCAELRRAGWLEQAGRGLSDAGRPCNTWRVIR